MDVQPPGPWNDLLRQALEERAQEAGEGEATAESVIEWLAEWGREVRRRQHGLLLLTAHRAKGLEFDHVAILDGGWDRLSPEADADEARRLYYVAMTRARETLVLARMGERHVLQDTLQESGSVLFRQPVRLAPAAPELRNLYVRASLQDVDLGFAGRQARGRPVHRAISRLSPGDPLQFSLVGDGKFALLDSYGVRVGRLASRFRPPRSMRCRSAEVLAIVGWSREESEPQFQERAKCDSWEVVVPELVFEPE